MRVVSKKMLGSAAAIAIIASAPTAAFAFDEVNWRWDKQIDEQVDINITINAELEPTGMTEIEKLQIQIGDVNASSIVRDVHNNQPVGAGGGTGTFSETFSFTTDTVENLAAPDDIMPDGPHTQNGVTGRFVGGTLDEAVVGPNGMGDLTTLTFMVDGTVAVNPTDSFDARTELPTVDSVATAVGNNQAVNSDVATYLHDAQFLFDQGDVANGEAGIEDVIGAAGAVLLGSQFSGNSHTALAVGASVLAITGTIGKADIDSTSAVYNILNARVDSAATAVGNNASFNVNADGSPTGDSILIADLTQFSLADVTASSRVHNVAVNNYTHLGAGSVSPLVSSAATAVGNNVSVNVGDIGS